MERRDYILRQIEQLSRILRRVLELLHLRRPAEARAELEAGARTLGIRLPMASALTSDSLLALLSLSGRLDGGAALAYAELLRAESLIAREEGDTRRAAASAEKALRLLLRLRSESADDASARSADLDAHADATINELLTSLAGTDLPSALRAEIERYRSVIRDP